MAHDDKDRHMKVLVTGARGLLGQELCRQLTHHGARVWAIDNGFRGGDIPPCDEFIEADISRDLDLDHDMEYIFHMAAINGTEYFYSMPNQVLQNNLLVDQSMFALATRCSNLKNFVYASSSEVVSGHQHQPVKEITDITVQDSLNPRWSYRLAKMCGEHYLANSSLPWLILRYFNVYGVESRSGHFVYDLRQKIAKGDFTLWGADETRSFCHVSDAVEATIKISQHKRTIINVGSYEEITVLDAANTLAQALQPGIDVDWHCVPGRPGSARRRRPSVCRLRQIYNDFAPRSFQKGIQECVPVWLHQSLT